MYWLYYYKLLLTIYTLMKFKQALILVWYAIYKIHISYYFYYSNIKEWYSITNELPIINVNL